MDETTDKKKNESSPEELENREWVESIDYVLRTSGPERVSKLLKILQIHAQKKGVKTYFTANTPYINTFPVEMQPPYPGDQALEWNIRSLIRWNAMAMVVRANRIEEGIGGHISTFASAAALYEVAFNHLLRAKNGNKEGDIVYFQGHASPGIYARAFLEGRRTIERRQTFRRELLPGGGLSSYPHPWLLPHFWQFPTVSMGLSPIMSIYQARFNRYLEDRGLKKHSDARVWAFLGDGECDEPEALGAITLASREKLDNLIFVVNCNLQRLDGPVRGNGKIIQELEADFRGSGWNVLKVIWGSYWDPLLAMDTGGLLKQRMEEAVDGEYQNFKAKGGAYTREHFFGKYPGLKEMVAAMSDNDIWRLNRGGHDPHKVYAAYAAAVSHKGQPSVILAKTVKGYGMGAAGEAQNPTHQAKSMDLESLRAFRDRFEIPVSDADLERLPFYRPAENSPEMQYLRERRAALGGYLPARRQKVAPSQTPPLSAFENMLVATGEREISTTMAFVRILSTLLRDKAIGKNVVPIVPDEARTFGMEGMFRQLGIYSSQGQLYEPMDSDQVMYYKESKDGQILEEGINEAGSFAS